MTFLKRLTWTTFWLILFVFSLTFAVACGGHLPPINPPGPKPTPTPTPQPIPDPQCSVTGQAHSCWHWPPDSTMPLYACPVKDANGGVVGVINVTGGPAQCPVGPVTPPTPEPPKPTPPPVGGETNCDGLPGGLTGQTTSTFGTAVNEAMRDITGCSIGSDCPLGNTTNQTFFRAVIDKLRAKGICAGQHEPNHTDEIAVSSSRSAIREGYHIFGGDDSAGPVPPGGTPRKVVWSPGAARPSYYGTSDAPPNPQPTPPPSGDCPAQPCPIRTWTKENLPDGWGDNEIGHPAYYINAHPYTGGLIDTTPRVTHQQDFCVAIGYNNPPVHDCPMRPDGHPDRRAVEDWAYFGGSHLEGRNGETAATCAAPNGNPAMYRATGNCRLCNNGTGITSLCTAW